MDEMTDSQALHRTVLLTEAADEVSRARNGIFIDATFGRGGHSRAVLARIAPDARLIAFDRDPEAIKSAAAITDPRFSIVHAPFSEMKEQLAALGISQVNGILMDIGVSSPQIDEAGRGFSFRMDGPLDMRMDTTCGLTAAQWLAQASESDIARVLRDYGALVVAYPLLLRFGGNHGAAIMYAATLVMHIVYCIVLKIEYERYNRFSISK